MKGIEKSNRVYGGTLRDIRCFVYCHVWNLLGKRTSYSFFFLLLAFEPPMRKGIHCITRESPNLQFLFVVKKSYGSVVVVFLKFLMLL